MKLSQITHTAGPGIGYAEVSISASEQASEWHESFVRTGVNVVHNTRSGRGVRAGEGNK